MKREKEILLRRDILTYRRYKKNELIRLVITRNEDDGTNWIYLDTKNKIFGRGVYIHQSSLAKIINNSSILKKKLARFKVNFSDNLIEDLKIINGKEK